MSLREFPIAELRAGKQVGINMLQHYDVFSDITVEEAERKGLEYVRARWENQRRGTSIKCRWVAQQFKLEGERDW